MRFRKDLGDLTELKRSIKEIGPIHPIVVDSDGVLIAGERRLTACQELGIEPEYRVVDFENPEQAQIDENTVRKDFTPSEIFAIQEYYNKKLSRQGDNRGEGKGFERVRSDSDQTDQPRDVVAKIVNRHPDTLSKINQIFKSEYGEIKKKVDENKISIDKGYKEIKRKEKIQSVEEKRKALPIPDDVYKVIYADPPWKYNDEQDTYLLGGAVKHYPTMSITELCEMEIPKTENDAVLFLWVTSPLLEECFGVIKSWGFKYKSSFVWDKIKHNMGHYNSVRHEFLLICTKGSGVPENVKLFDSVQSIEKEKHSKKPLEFYEIIETLYPTWKKIEMFARNKRNGWDSWGNEI